MSIGRQPEQPGTMWVGYDEIPKGKGHAFYDYLQKVLCGVGFDDFAEKLCAEYYALIIGRPSIPPGRYFRMLLVGYFEGIDSERGICWRCADSLSLREFLRLDTGQKVPDHSSLCHSGSVCPLKGIMRYSPLCCNWLPRRASSRARSWASRFQHGSQRGPQKHRAPRYQ